MKLLGAVLLTAAASVMGFFKARELKVSSQSLREIISLLELMRNEICTRRTPIKQIFSCSNLPDYRYMNSFISSLETELSSLGSKSFTQIWCENAEKTLQMLSKSSRQALKDLGSSIGKYDAELQAASIDRCISELSSEYEKLNEGLKNNEKMYIGLGTGIGLIAAIILV